MGAGTGSKTIPGGYPCQSLGIPSSGCHCLYICLLLVSILQPSTLQAVAHSRGGQCIPCWCHTGAATDASIKAGALTDVPYGFSYLQTISIAHFLGSWSVDAIGEW